MIECQVYLNIEKKVFQELDILKLSIALIDCQSYTFVLMNIIISDRILYIIISCHKYKKKFSHHKILAKFQITLEWEGEHKPWTIKLLSYLARNNMENYYPCTWVSFANKENEKIRDWNLMIICYFFKTTDLFTVYLFCEYADN